MLLGAVLLALSGASAPAFAQQQRPTPGRPAPNVQGLARGQQWTNRGQVYAVLPEVHAVLGGRSEPDSAAFARAGVKGGPVIERKSGFLIYKQAPATRAAGAPAAAGLAATAGQDPRPVAMNLGTQRLAVVVGALRAELKEAGTAEAVATSLGIQLGREFPSHRVAFFAAPAGADLLDVLGKLRVDPRVAAADLELIEHTRMPR